LLLVADRLHARFHNGFEEKKQSEQSVKSGREFVESYIDYTHNIERIFQATHGKTIITQ